MPSYRISIHADQFGKSAAIQRRTKTGTLIPRSYKEVFEIEKAQPSEEKIRWLCLFLLLLLFLYHLSEQCIWVATTTKYLVRIISLKPLYDLYAS